MADGVPDEDEGGNPVVAPQAPQPLTPAQIKSRLETLWSNSHDTRVVTHNVTPQRLFEGRMPEGNQEHIQDGVVALEQVEGETLRWNPNMFKDDAKLIGLELWCVATHGVKGNMPNFKMHPKYRARKITTSDNSHYSKLVLIIPVMLLVGPEYNLGALKKSDSKLDTLTILRDTDKLGFVQHFMQVVNERGDSRNFLKKGWKKVAQDADCSSYMTHLHELASEKGYYSWTYVNRICDPDDNLWDADADVNEMTAGVPFELGVVLRFLSRGFPIPNDTENKWFVMDAEKAQLVNRVVYRHGVNPPTALDPLW